MTTPITLSTAHATSRRRACVRLGRIKRLVDDEKAGNVAEGLHGTAVAVDGARATRHEALPVIDAWLAGLEGEGDDGHAPRGRRGGLQGTAVAEDVPRATRHEALPVIDAWLAGLEGEGDDVHAPRGRRRVHSLERNEHSEVGDGEGVGRGRRVGDRAEVPPLLGD